MSRLSTSLLLLALAPRALAHMSIWAPGMYGVNNDGSFEYDVNAGDPVAPLGPDWTTQSDWWFRGPAARALPPRAGVVEVLPAGGKWNVEIACHKDWTKYGPYTTVPGSDRDACPGNTGAYHAGDAGAPNIDVNDASGCALGIADVDDISKVTMDNFAIFSVKHDCITKKQNAFDVPAMMPACTGKKCICGWMWLANQGIGNFYMTAFDCTVTGVHPDATPIAPPVDPTWCDRDELAAGRCKTQAGSKRPLYAYNSPTNIKEWKGNYDRPGYHANWSFGKNGAQDDIFMPRIAANTSAPATVPAASSVVAALPASTPLAASSPVLASPSPVVQLPPVLALPLPVTSTRSAPAVATSAAPVAAQPVNLALGAYADASTTVGPSTGASVMDGFIDGYKEDDSGDESKEWVSQHEGKGAWVRLSYVRPITINQIVLYDRPNLVDQIISANLLFSDGSLVATGMLKNDGSATYINLAQPKTTSSITLQVTGVRRGNSMVGLSEMQLFLVDPKTFTSTPKTVTKAPRRAPASKNKTRHARDFSSTGEDFGEDQLLVDADIVRRSVGRDLVEEKLFE